MDEIITQSNGDQQGQVHQETLKAHGIGTAVEGSGSYVYEGQWKEGRPHGKGRSISYYMIYEGDWVNGQQSGMGKQT